MHEAPGRAGQSDEWVLERTRRWLERAVIGLNLCPFAKAVHVKQQIHWVVARATEPADLLDCLQQELLDLQACPPEVRDTTLLIMPDALPDFLAFNDFLYPAEKLLRKLRLDGDLQIASFHPAFQFAQEPPDALSHYTNRAPYPILHLLREASIDRAVEAFPDAEAIYSRNIATLDALGAEGWRALDVSAYPQDATPLNTLTHEQK